MFDIQPRYDESSRATCLRRMLRHGTSCAALVASALLAAQSASAQVAPPPSIVGACSGVSLPRSVVTDILSPVVTGIVTPVQNTINPILGVVGTVLPLVPPLGIDAAGLLADAAAGNPITLQVLNANGTIVGPADRCDVQADGFMLRTPQGIAIGGNRITGLGSTGLAAVAGEANSIAFGNSAATDATAPGAIAFGSGSSVGANATGAMALGTGASATAAKGVALGAGSIAARGPLAAYTVVGLVGTQASAGEVSVGAPGLERQITNVAAGSAPTDAVNVGQLAGVQAQIGAVATGSVLYDSETRDRVTLTGTNGTVIANVAAGSLAPGSTEAVNGSQLFATNAQVATNTTAIANLGTQVVNNTTAITNLGNQIANGAASPVQYSNAATPTTPNGGVRTNDVTLVGAAAGAVKLHNIAAGSTAAGSSDAVNGGQLNTTNQAVAAAQGSANAALTLGNNSVQYGPGRTTVTFNAGGTASVLNNVAAGVSATDAANVGQLSAGVNTAITQSNAYTDTRIAALGFDLRNVRRDGSAGTSGALAAAGLPQAYEAGKGMIAIGGGTYGGQSAFALGVSKAFDDGHTVMKLSGTYDSQGRAGASGGIGYQF